VVNHPVLVEGNGLNPPAGNPGPVLPGTCGDYDGDTRIGTAEDLDGDRVFGTLTAALGGGTGANQNGSVIIVTSGVFAEVVTITAVNGNVTLEAAPGVEADIDAVLQGDPGSGGRQNAPGIIVDAPDDRRVIIRNVRSRNWTTGIQVRGRSHVTIESVRVENNTNWGIHLLDEAQGTTSESEVSATGHRVGAARIFLAAINPCPA
jgi:pectin methylesterase-like acyl-CoA thioesterase